MSRVIEGTSRSQRESVYDDDELSKVCSSLVAGIKSYRSNERYTTFKRLNGHGRVFLVVTSQGGQQRVLKCDALDKDKSAIRNYYEAIMTRYVCMSAHPHIVRLFDVFLCFSPKGTTPYVAMELEHCTTNLNELFALHRGRFPARAIRRVAQHVLQALVYMHENEIAHCDIKPANLLIQFAPSGAGAVEGDLDNMVVKVADFGASRRMPFSRNRFPASYEVNAIGWRPIEILFELPFGYEVDIWALGLLLVMLCSLEDYPLPWWPAAAEENAEGVRESPKREAYVEQIHRAIGIPADFLHAAGREPMDNPESDPVEKRFDRHFAHVKTVSRRLFALCKRMLEPVADYRVSAEAALLHPLFCN